MIKFLKLFKYSIIQVMPGRVLRTTRRVFYSFGTSGRSYDVYTISRRKAAHIVVMYTYITTLTVHFGIASFCAKGTGAPSIPSLLFCLAS